MPKHERDARFAGAWAELWRAVHLGNLKMAPGARSESLASASKRRSGGWQADIYSAALVMYYFISGLRPGADVR